MTVLLLRSRAVGQQIARLPLSLINWKIVCLLSAMIFLFSLVFHIILVNGIAEGIYLAKSYEGEINRLREENRMLESQFVGTSFLGDIKERAKDLGFERTAAITYEYLGGNSLVLSSR